MRTSIFAGLKGEGLRPQHVNHPVATDTDDFIDEAIGLAPIRLTGNLRLVNTIDGRAIVRDEPEFNTTLAENRLVLNGYRCEVQDGAVIVQDPYHQDGVVAGYVEVILRNPTDLYHFLEERS